MTVTTAPPTGCPCARHTAAHGYRPEAERVTVLDLAEFADSQVPVED